MRYAFFSLIIMSSNLTGLTPLITMAGLVRKRTETKENITQFSNSSISTQLVQNLLTSYFHSVYARTKVICLFSPIRIKTTGNTIEISCYYYLATAAVLAFSSTAVYQVATGYTSRESGRSS